MPRICDDHIKFPRILAACPTQAHREVSEGTLSLSYFVTQPRLSGPHDEMAFLKLAAKEEVLMIASVSPLPPSAEDMLFEWGDAKQELRTYFTDTLKGFECGDAYNPLACPNGRFLRHFEVNICIGNKKRNDLMWLLCQIPSQQASGGFVAPKSAQTNTVSSATQLPRPVVDTPYKVKLK
jgi:hypothetical protein